MPKSYPCDLRERVIEMVEAGASRHEAAAPRGGSVSPLEYQAERVVAVITDQPDLTLEETAADLRRYRIRTSRSSLSRFFQRHDITFKKGLRGIEWANLGAEGARKLCIS